MVTRRIGTREPASKAEEPSSSYRPAETSSGERARDEDPTSTGRALGYLRGGRFTLDRELGSGGEGVVYLARDRLRKDRVAVKMLHVDGARSFALLKREFRFLKGLIHPNLVPLYELFVESDEAFFSMAFVEGQHFFQAAGLTHPLRPLLHQLIDVVTYLHHGGIVHCDLKPSNVLVRPDGRLTLVDFGAALHVHRAEAGAAIVGTPEYMAPELFHGQPPSPRSDAYSVGIILYEALTRRRPWQGEVLPRLREVVPETPPDLDEFCAALMEYDPRERATLSEARALLKFAPTRASRWPEPTADPSDREPFTGREQELLQLETAYGRMLEGQEPILLFVSGPSGMGKTALLERFASLHQDALVLSGVCSDSESIRYKALDSILPPLQEFLRSERAQAAGVLEGLSSADKVALTQLFPELEEHSELRTRPKTNAPEAGARALQSAAGRALSKLLEAVAKLTPLVLILDDLQWGDEDSARLLYEAFASSHAPRCLLVLAYRSDLFDSSRCLLALRQGTDCLEDGLPTVEVQLGALPAAESFELAKRLARGRLPTRQLEQVIALAAGSPFYITEYISELVAAQGTTASSGELPFTYETLLKARLTSLSPKARELFFLICLSGVLPIHRWPALKLGPIGRYVDELCASRLCRTEEGSSSLVPFHDKVRSAALAALGKVSPMMHQTLAEVWLEEPADAGRVATHYFAAGSLELAESWAVQAADFALARLLVDRAVDFYRLALAAVPESRASLRELRERQLAEALADAGRGAEAAPLLARLAKTAPADLAALYRRRAVEQWLSSGAVSEGLDLLEEVHREARLSWPRSPKAAVLAVARYRAEIALRALPSRGAPPSSNALVEKQLETCRTAWAVAHVSTAHGAANSARYLAIALRAKGERHLAYALGMEACYRSTQGTTARQVVERFRESSERLMPEPHSGYADGFQAFVQAQTRYFLSDVKGAYAHFERAEKVFSDECKSVAWELAASRLFWSSTLIFLGRMRELDRRMRRWLRDAQSRRDLYALVGLQIWYARRLALRDGDADEALALIDSATSGWTSPYLGTHVASARIVTAHTQLIVKRPDLALEQLEKMQREVGSTMLPRVQILRVSWLILRATSEVALALERPPHARSSELARLRSLLKPIARERTPFASAGTLHLRACLAYLSGRDEVAAQQLRQAALEYRSSGFELHAASIERCLGRLLGGDEGEKLVSLAEASFHRSDVDTQGGVAGAYAPDLVGARRA